MSLIGNSNFYQNVAAFARNHKVLCVLTLGFAVVGVSIGNLAGRGVCWIYRCMRTTKKTNDMGLKNISNLSDSSKKMTNSSKHDNNSVQSSVPNLNSTHHINIDLRQLQSTQNLLTAYNTPKEGWVMVPPKDEMQIDQPFVIGSGAVGFSENGRWKIHVSIDPNQMEQAIPIFMEVLYGPNAPRLGFKMQTKANLNSVHQIGKEFAIIFDKKVEADAIKGDSNAVENCLSALWKKLYDAGIHPEPGVVLTPQTMEIVRAAPNGSQIKEKQNLETGKFDRAISCPKNCNFFYYRDENFAPMRDDEIGDLRGIPGVYAASDIANLACQQPDLAHNPTQSPDPFLHLQIQEH